MYRSRGDALEIKGRKVALASGYAALERLQDKAYAVSTLGEPAPERVGRAKRYSHLTPARREAVYAESCGVDQAVDRRAAP